MAMSPFSGVRKQVGFRYVGGSRKFIGFGLLITYLSEANRNALIMSTAFVFCLS